MKRLLTLIYAIHNLVIIAVELLIRFIYVSVIFRVHLHHRQFRSFAWVIFPDSKCARRIWGYVISESCWWFHVWLRYIYHLVYAILNYEFQYMLRTDGDYFTCLDRLLYELPSPVAPMFHWGYVHTSRPNVFRLDESIAIFSKDVISDYLFQSPNTLYYHAMASQ